MNTTLLKLAFTGANGAYNYLRNTKNKKEGEIYEALLDAVRNGRFEDFADDANIDDLEDLLSSARAEAGDVTRDIHDRLDRRRAAFAAAAPDREARRKALQHDARAQLKKNKKKGGTAGKVVGGVLATAGLAYAGWKVWKFYLADKLAENKSGNKTYTPAPTRTETDKAGTSTLVYSTRTEDATVTNDPENTMRPVADIPGSAGPLGEEPAQRDEELLASIDEQLTTLDTLEDDQREATAPRHGGVRGGAHGGADTSSDVLKDTGSGRRSDKVSDADTTVGASGRHELRKDEDER